MRIHLSVPEDSAAALCFMPPIVQTAAWLTGLQVCILCVRFARSWWRNPEMFWSEMADYTVFSIFLGEQQACFDPEYAEYVQSCVQYRQGQRLLCWLRVVLQARGACGPRTRALLVSRGGAARKRGLTDA